MHSPAVTPRRQHGLIGALNADWASHAELPTWSDPELRYPTTDALLSALAHADVDHADAILHALICHAHRGDAHAIRTVLQAMLGVAARLTRTARNRGLEDCEALAVAALLEAIRTYPRHLNQRVAANVRMRALAALPAAPVAREIPSEHTVALLDARGSNSSTTPVDVEASNLLSWALEHGVLTQEDACLLRRAHLCEAKVPTAALAAEMGLSCAAYRQRHHRLVRRLSQAVRDRHLDPSTDVAA